MFRHLAERLVGEAGLIARFFRDPPVGGRDFHRFAPSHWTEQVAVLRELLGWRNR